MSSNSSMNRIVCSEEGKREIRNEPTIAVESYPIYYGCGIDGRDHDIVTSQTLSNGVVLYYTPTNDPIEARQSTQSTQQPSTSRELREGDKGSRGWITPARLPMEPAVIMSHGGVHGIQADAFKQFCSGIARRSPVLAFQKDRGDAKDAIVNRTAAFSYLWLMNDMSGKAMGGRSRGARCATQAYTRVLFIKGTKDWMGPEIIFSPVRREMKAKSWCIYVQDMDHNFRCQSDLQEQKICNAIGTLAGIWLNGDPKNNNMPWNPEDGTEMGMAWDAKRGEVTWTEWQPLGDKPPQADIVQHDIAAELAVKA